MAIISKNYVFTAGATIVAAEHNSNFDTVYNEFNGNIDNNNISASAAIVDTKLATISTPNKVNAAALSTLASTPSGAGLLPIANIPTGTGTNAVVILSADSTLPALTASNLTTLNATNISSGTVPTARLGSGTADTTTYLRGDSSWQTLGGNSNNIYSWNGTATNNFTSYNTFAIFRYVKVAGVSKATLHFNGTLVGGFSTKTGTYYMSMGSLSITAVTVSTGWETTTNLDISSLSNGSTYDCVLQTKGGGTGTPTSYAATVVVS